jgi:hypothetical protein
MMSTYRVARGIIELNQPLTGSGLSLLLSSDAKKVKILIPCNPSIRSHLPASRLAKQVDANTARCNVHIADIVVFVSFSCEPAVSGCLAPIAHIHRTPIPWGKWVVNLLRNVDKNLPNMRTERRFNGDDSI